MQVHQIFDFLLHNNHNTWDQKGTPYHVMLSPSKLGGNKFLWAYEKPKKSIHFPSDIALKRRFFKI